MKVVYYKSIICPKCIPTNRLIKRLKQTHPEIEVEEIEIITHMARARADGVRHVPTIIAGGKRFYHAPALEELLDVLQMPQGANGA
jgi:glutaredoxin